MERGDTRTQLELVSFSGGETGLERRLHVAIVKACLASDRQTEVRVLTEKETGSPARVEAEINSFKCEDLPVSVVNEQQAIDKEDHKTKQRNKSER